MTETPERDGLTPRVKYGLIVGAVGLVLNTCFSAIISCCGPLAALLAGAVAGALAAREEDPLPRTTARAWARFPASSPEHSSWLGKSSA
jgi:hypothetical protein